VAEDITYFAIIRDGQSAAEPSGLARRTFTPAGRLDETLRQDLTWRRDSAIYEWERGEEMGADLIEISQAVAQGLVDRFRAEWGEEG